MRVEDKPVGRLRRGSGLLTLCLDHDELAPAHSCSHIYILYSLSIIISLALLGLSTTDAFVCASNDQQLSCGTPDNGGSLLRPTYRLALFPAVLIQQLQVMNPVYYEAFEGIALPHTGVGNYLVRADLIIPFTGKKLGRNYSVTLTRLHHEATGCISNLDRQRSKR